MGFLKLTGIIVVLELVIFLLGNVDIFLRKNVTLYAQYVPVYWWFTEVWAEMNTNQQAFTGSLPKLTRVLWTPVIIWVTVCAVKLVGLSS